MREIIISGAGNAEEENFARERIRIKGAEGLKKEEGEIEKDSNVYGFIEQVNLVLKAESEAMGFSDAPSIFLLLNLN